MKRCAITPRQDWQASLERLGFSYHSIDGNYWQETAYYAFDDAQIDVLETATQELHAMYLQAIAKIVQVGDYEHLGVTEHQAALIEQSFLAKDPCLYGRFDLSYDGVGAPKLLEYNADTPTALFEASVAQWYWLKERPDLNWRADQFNSIHEQLVLAWQSLSQTHHWQKVYFCAVTDSIEDLVTCRYLQDTAIQAGIKTSLLDMTDIGYDGVDFVDLVGAPMQTVFKLYPWEWLTEEPFGVHLDTTRTQWLEPAWKLLLSNKAMLCVLWQMFEGHPNLLPCYFDETKLGAYYVKKPFFSREGANISLKNGQSVEYSTGDYGQEGYVYQAVKPLPKFVNTQGQAVYAVIGSWVIEHTPAGIGIREDSSLITKDSSLFVPHVFY